MCCNNCNCQKPNVNEQLLRETFDEGVRVGFDKCAQKLSNDLERASQSIFEQGVDAGVNALSEDITANMAVEGIYFQNKGNRTVVKYSDKSVSVVDYDPDCGYPYDKEKAIMAAMLKHIYGNYYIHVLESVIDYSKKNCIIEDNYDDVETIPDIFIAPNGDRVNLSDDEKLLLDISDMSEEIVF